MSAKVSDPKSGRKLTRLNTSGSGPVDEKNRRVFALRIVDQKDAVEAALAAARRSRSKLRDPDRPISVIIEVGPSRTGKTYVAETLAEALHGNKRCLVKINGGSYTQKHEVARLIGAPPGYLGYQEADDDSSFSRRKKLDKSAKLTRSNLIASRGDSENPVTVVLLDEVTRMHRDFDDVLMSIFDKGELDMGNNNVTDFRDCIFIMTSNLGMDEVKRLASRGIGFGAKDGQITHELIEKTVRRALSDRYAPEFLNRIDVFVVFKPHANDSLLTIVDKEIGILQARMEAQLPRGQVFNLEVELCAKEFLLTSTLADNSNIANLKRMLQQYLIDELDKLLEQNLLGNGDTVVVRHEAGTDHLDFFLEENINVPENGLKTARASSDTSSLTPRYREQDRVAIDTDFID